MIKTDNYVDKSLEEALHHIDKLKEDMNHLCKDIDSLYNIKGGSGEFTTAAFKLDENDDDDYTASNDNNEYEEIDHIKSLIDSNNLIESNQLVNESMRHLRDNLDQFKSKKQLVDHLSRTCDQRCQCIYSENYTTSSYSTDMEPSAGHFHCRNSFCVNSITNKVDHKNPKPSSITCNESYTQKQQQAATRLVNPVNISRITKRTTLPNNLNSFSSSRRRRVSKSSSFHKKSSSYYCSLSAKKLSDQSIRQLQS